MRTMFVIVTLAVATVCDLSTFLLIKYVMIMLVMMTMIQLPEVNTAKLPTPKLSVMVKFERLSGL